MVCSCSDRMLAERLSFWRHVTRPTGGWLQCNGKSFGDAFRCAGISWQQWQITNLVQPALVKRGNLASACLQCNWRWCSRSDLTVSNCQTDMNNKPGLWACSLWIPCYALQFLSRAGVVGPTFLTVKRPPTNRPVPSTFEKNPENAKGQSVPAFQFRLRRAYPRPVGKIVQPRWWKERVLLQHAFIAVDNRNYYVVYYFFGNHISA